MLALMVFACLAAAADKEVKGKVVKLDAKKNTLTVNTLDGKKVYTRLATRRNSSGRVET
jgi:hypothetical protein